MSDSDSRDSDEGVRYKTESVRNKVKLGKSLRDDFRDKYYNRSSKSSSSYSSKSSKRHSHSPSSETKRHKSTLYSYDTLEKNKSFPSRNNSNFGPVLPPHLLDNKKKDESCIKDQVKNSIEQIVGPGVPTRLPWNKKYQIGSHLCIHLPENKTDYISSDFQSCSKKGIITMQKEIDLETEKLVLGPQAPQSFQKPFQHKPSDDNTNENTKERMIGPQLPSHLQKSCDNKPVSILGPSLPPQFQQKLEEQVFNTKESKEEETEQEDIYGPLPAAILHHSNVQKALEERALQIKIDQLETTDNKDPTREIWMLELPESKAANFGLGSRQFRSRAGPDLSDRSAWTDIPGEKSSRNKNIKETVDLKLEAESKELEKRDKEQELLTKNHKKKNKTLLEIHQKKLEKQKKDEGVIERRPFSREVDLQVNRFDEAQKKAIFKKAQLLNDRFSSGKSKYL